MQDSYGRTINYMRISVTDRCNLRCRYCMPHGITLTSMDDILTFEEITEVVKAAVTLGITRFKVTGGEPLARKGLPSLIGMISSVPGVGQVTLTTNGVLLEESLDELRANGLDAVNISLDTLDRKRYEQITGRDELYAVLSAIDAAVSSGLRTKLNVVPLKDINEDDLISLAAMAKAKPLDVRFIEMMPIGHGQDFAVIGNDEVFSRISNAYPGITPDNTVHGNGPAVYYRIPGFKGGTGFISAIHGKFCDSCNRLRLTGTGACKLCLCYDTSVDLRSILRTSTEENRHLRLVEALTKAISNKPRAHRFDRSEDITERHDMVSIGG